MVPVAVVDALVDLLGKHYYVVSFPCPVHVWDCAQ